jgi:hypothetical protein
VCVRVFVGHEYNSMLILLYTECCFIKKYTFSLYLGPIQASEKSAMRCELKCLALFYTFSIIVAAVVVVVVMCIIIGFSIFIIFPLFNYSTATTHPSIHSIHICAYEHRSLSLSLLVSSSPEVNKRWLTKKK